MLHPINILERYWKHTSFRPMQEAIIQSVLNGNDTFALLPTGGGKSLCFQIPAIAKPGICIVISPLVALIKNQVETLNSKGIKAMGITSGISVSQLDTLLDNCIYGNYKFLYLSPERLQQELVQARIKQMHVNLIAVDEAHCISQWGNDFRPAYNNIITLRSLHPTVNIIALTASATPKVVDDIMSNLDFLQPNVFKQSFNRPNLAYMVFNTEDKLHKVCQILKKNQESSIIFVRNRKATYSLSKQLNMYNIQSTYYHGGLSTDEKNKALDLWLNNQKQVMVATNAFGMGIDKATVRTVIHLNLPESIESYFQEAGRAGRDGKKSYAVILKNKNDSIQIKKQFLNVLPSIDFIKLVYRKICNYFQISYGEGMYQTFQFNFIDFCKTYKFNTSVCFNALQLLDRTSVIKLSKQFNNKLSIKFCVSNAHLLKYLNHLPHSIIIKTILRTYGGVFEQDTKISTVLISEKTGTKESHIIQLLKQLETDRILQLTHIKTDAQITFIEPREDAKTIHRVTPFITQQNQLKQQQVNSIITYSNNDAVCKNIQLLSYFGETNLTPCGICSVCIKTNSNSTVDFTVLKADILNQLQIQPLNSRALFEKLPYPESVLISGLKYLLEHNHITLTEHNTYQLQNL